MNLYSIPTGNFKLDGGAMFGVVPKSIWSKTNPADDQNLCTWAMRCLLLESGQKRILIDTGIGDKQDARFFSFYHLHGSDSLKDSLARYGFVEDDITDVVLTHLHFDHCGGSIVRNPQSGKLIPRFKNATYHCHKKHWDWAINPNPREKASFLKDNIIPLQESGQLQFLDTNNPIHPEFEWLEVYGHTEAMVLPLIPFKNTKLLYLADLIPSIGHLPIPYVMGYDVRPLQTLSEKNDILNSALKNQWILFFEHDPSNECCLLEQTERGIRSRATFSLSDF
ncbi:MAG: hypothetical protein RIR05_1493 [Bacteroidota bacterium]